MLVLALESGYTRYSSLSLWYFLELVNVGGCSGHARHNSLFLARGRLSIRSPSRLHDWKGRCCGTVRVVRREITTRRPPCFDHMYTSWSVCFRWDQMCNVLVLHVTSSSPRRPRDSTSRVKPSCLTTGAVESPRPSICLARKVHSGEMGLRSDRIMGICRWHADYRPCISAYLQRRSKVP